MLPNIKLQKPIAFIDLETTGVHPESDKIVEVSALRIQPDGTKEYKSHLINPEVPIPYEAISVHKITDEAVAKEPSFRQYAKGLCSFLDGCDIAGFNLITFDIPFLKVEFDRAGVEFSCESRQIVDIMIIYHQVEPAEPGKTRKLKDAYRKYLGTELENAHGAENDATATAEILNLMIMEHDILPQDVPGLCDFCNEIRKDYIDIEGKLIWTEREATFSFGKHSGQTLREVAIEYSDYLQWILSSDFRPDFCDILEKALRGEFPQQL